MLSIIIIIATTQNNMIELRGPDLDCIEITPNDAYGVPQNIQLTRHFQLQESFQQDSQVDVNDSSNAECTGSSDSHSYEDVDIINFS